MNACAEVVQTQKAPRPLTYPWETGSVRCTAVCIAPNGEDLSFKNLYTQEEATSPLGHRVARDLQEHGVTHAFAPSVATMNAQIVDPLLLSTKLQLPYGVTLYRNKRVLADGLPLDPDQNDAFVMSGGGCPIVVAIADGAVVAAHASRDSLLDRVLIEKGRPSREHASVIDAIGAQFDEWRIARDSIEIRVFFSIPRSVFAHDSDHEVNGPYYRKMYAHVTGLPYGKYAMDKGTGCLSIPALVSCQAREAGFAEGGAKAHCVLSPGGQFAHTRHSNPLLKNARNLEFVRVERIPTNE